MQRFGRENNIKPKMGKAINKPQSLSVDGQSNNENINNIILPRESVQVHNDTQTILLIIIVVIFTLNMINMIKVT